MQRRLRLLATILLTAARCCAGSVAKQFLIASRIEPRHGSDFQKLAKLMNVDAVLVGSVTDYSPYCPPRIGLAVDWYAANPGFHPTPPGYGLPWGKAEEEFIPNSHVNEAEFALAREQLKTQTLPTAPPAGAAGEKEASFHISDEGASKSTGTSGEVASLAAGRAPAQPADSIAPPLLSPDWPDPRGFTPPAPSSERPPLRPQYDPIITHTRTYNGQDATFTERLATYYYLRDDARFGGWAGYLQRPGDFTQFACYLHATETLAARGGAGDARVLWRWPIRRYER
jgi:hypothetical protein